MIRKLLATTALATLVATGAIAQTTTPDPAAPTVTQDVPMVVKAEGNLASNIIGESVYNGTGDDAESIGEVNDIVIGKDGSIQAVVIGVGGFLGIGQKDVAIEYDLVEWVDQDGDRWLIVETTADALKAQQEFDRLAYQPMPADAQVAETKPATKEDLAKAPAAEGEAVPADDTAAAPAEEAPAEDMAEAPADEAPADDTAAAPADEAPADDTAAAPADEAPADDTAAAPADEAPAEDTAVAPIEEAPAEDTAAAPADEATDETQTSAIDRSSLNELDTSGMTAEEFIGTSVYGADDEMIGEVGDIALTEDGQVDAVILDVGGFLGVGEKEIAVGMDNLAFMTDADGNQYLYTEFTQEQLEAQPAYEKDAYADRRDEMRLTIEN